MDGSRPGHGPATDADLSRRFLERLIADASPDRPIDGDAVLATFDRSLSDGDGRADRRAVGRALLRAHAALTAARELPPQPVDLGGPGGGSWVYSEQPVTMPFTGSPAGLPFSSPPFGGPPWSTPAGIGVGLPTMPGPEESAPLVFETARAKPRAIRWPARGPLAGPGRLRSATRIDGAGLAVVFTWIRNLGAVILLFVAWQLWGTAISEHHAQDSLQQQFESKLHSGDLPKGVTKSSTSSNQVQLIPASQRFGNPADGTPVAQLEIPKIGLTQYVVSGTTTDDLSKGPGHYVGTALPGQAGNVAIAGHRTTHGAPFNRLAELAVGDPIYLTTSWGEKLTYVVSQTPYPVSPSDVSVLNDFGDNRLTLTTCNPEFSAAQRLIVVALLKEPPATPAPVVKAKPVAYHLAKQTDPGWNWGELPLAILLGAGLVLLGLWHRRLSSMLIARVPPSGRHQRLQTQVAKHVRWLIIAPIWIGLLYLLFGVLGNLLPASV